MTTATNTQTSVLIADEQTRRLYAGAYLSLSATLVNAVILAYFQWPVIEHRVIGTWLVVITVISIARFFLAWRFHRLQLDSNGLKLWNSYFLTGVLMAAIMWGSASYFLFPVDDVVHQALLVVIIAGMSAGAVSVLSANWNAVVIFIVPTLIPLSIRFFSIENTRFTVLGLAVIMFLFIMLSTAKRNHENVIAAIAARIEKQARRALEKSQQVFEDMVRNVPGVVFQFRLDNAGEPSFPYIAPSVNDMLGISASDIMHNPKLLLEILYSDKQMFPGSVAADADEISRRCDSSGHTTNRISGDTVWYRCVARATRDDDGETIWNGILFNTTSAKRIELDLQAVLEQMPDVFYRTDLDGTLVMVSPSAEKLIGYNIDELVGKRLASFYVENDGREKFLEALQKNDGVVTGYESALRRKDGNVVWVSTNAHYYLDSNGEVAGVEGITRDITLKREMLNELESYKQHFEVLAEERTKELMESQARLEYLLKSSPVMIYACKLQDDELLPSYCSDNIRELFGIEPDDFINNENFLLNHIHPHDIHSVMAGFETLLQTNHSTIEYRFNTGNDNYSWIHDELRLIRDKDGSPIEVIGCWLDITERKNIQGDLQKSEHRFRTLVENITDAIFVHSLDGKFIDVNQQACINLGYTRDELLKMSVPDIEKGANPDKLKKLWPEMEKGNVISIDGTHKRSDGSTFPVEVNISLIDMGSERCVIALARDVTRRKQAEDRLREINSELESFAYSVSHDLRAPLRSVNGFCNILVDEYAEHMDETAASYLNRIVAASKKMSDLIDDLLLLSRVSRKDLEPSKINLSRMIEDSLAQIRATDQEREITTKIESNLMIKADKGLMNVVVNNLVSNAWKYTSFRDEATIEFFSQKKDGETIFCLRDNGAGFNMDYIDKLFLPFQRLHTENEFEGSGIGLATVQRIITRHGGRIWAEAREGEGACFCFTLPQ